MLVREEAPRCGDLLRLLHAAGLGRDWDDATFRTACGDEVDDVDHELLLGALGSYYRAAPPETLAADRVLFVEDAEEPSPRVVVEALRTFQHWLQSPLPPRLRGAYIEEVATYVGDALFLRGHGAEDTPRLFSLQGDDFELYLLRTDAQSLYALPTPPTYHVSPDTEAAVGGIIRGGWLPRTFLEHLPDCVRCQCAIEEKLRLIDPTRRATMFTALVRRP